MQHTIEIYAFIEYMLFWLGIFILPIGLAFIIAPAYMVNISSKVNYWICTKGFFQNINKPRYQERLIYRNHKLFGLIVIVTSSICLFFLTYFYGLDKVEQTLLYIAKSEFEKWLFITCYYILIGGLSISIIIGLIIFFRPSLLKKIENTGNKWIETEEALEVFDTNRSLPEHILLDKPRMFGLAIFIGTSYIIWMTSPFK